MWSLLSINTYRDHTNYSITRGLTWRSQFRVFPSNKIKSNLTPVWLFTCNIWMLIKSYLSNYNGVIKATLLCADSVPYSSCYRGWAVGVIRSGCSHRPVLSTELQPPRSLSASHSCLNMSQDGGQCRIDVSILEALWLTTTTGQFNLCSNRLPTIRLGCFVSLCRCVLCFFGGRLGGVSEENSRPLPHIDESGSLADQKLILFVQFNIDRTLQLGKAGATPRGCADIETKQRGFLRGAFGWLSLLRVLQLLPERVAVVSPTL